MEQRALVSGLVGLGIVGAGIIGGIAIGRRAINEDESHPDAPRAPARAPAIGQPGAAPSLIAETYFARYDHDGNGLIDLRPRAFDEAVQERANASLEQVARWARGDERVASYTGVSNDDGLTLPMQHDLPLLMAAAQRPVGGHHAELAAAMLTRGQLTEAIAEFDADHDGVLQLAEVIALQQHYPTQVGNYRFVRVLHLGEWRFNADASKPNATHRPPEVDAPIVPQGTGAADATRIAEPPRITSFTG